MESTPNTSTQFEKLAEEFSQLVPTINILLDAMNQYLRYPTIAESIQGQELTEATFHLGELLEEIQNLTEKDYEQAKRNLPHIKTSLARYSSMVDSIYITKIDRNSLATETLRIQRITQESNKQIQASASESM